MDNDCDDNIDEHAVGGGNDTSEPDGSGHDSAEPTDGAGADDTDGADGSADGGADPADDTEESKGCSSSGTGASYAWLLTLGIVLRRKLR